MKNSLDFVGFTYDGKHSKEYFNIYRVSDGSRYSDNLIPQIQDKTVEITGRDGALYFNTSHKPKQFSISIAFDDLSEEKYQEMRSWLGKGKIAELIFDETPYKVYSAKPTGTPQLKTICFNEGDNRVYKGEGTIQFVCYYPYARTPNLSSLSDPILKTPDTNKAIKCGLFVQSGEQIKNKTSKAISCKYSYWENGKWEKSDVSLDLQSDTSKTTQQPMFIHSIDLDEYFTDEVIEIQIDELTYAYTENDCFEPTHTRDGRNINDYDIYRYPNKIEWVIASKLNSQFQAGYNNGDLPASFLVSKASVSVEDGNPVFQVGDCKITVLESCDNFSWDSETGMVKGVISGVERAIRYSGKSYGKIPVGRTDIQIGDATLKYNYWYY